MTKMASSSTEIYQSPGDRQRLDILLKTMRESGFNLAILGPDDITLAHYTRRIYEHLKQDPALQVELWSSMESDKLIERFNSILSELTVEQALDKSRKSEVRRYMIFPDAQAVQDFELQLLARLINGFPASNIHVVLLINRKESYERKLDAFGKHLMRWTLETEQPEPVRMKRIETQEEAAAQAPVPQAQEEWPVHKPELPPESAIEPVRESMASPAWMNEAPGIDASPAEISTAPSPVAAGPVRPRNASRVGWMVLLALVCTVGVFAMLYRDLITAEMVALQEYISGKKAAGKNKEPAQTKDSEEGKETSVAPPPTVGMSSTTQLPVKPDESLIPDKEALLPPASKSEAVVAEPAKPEPAKPEASKPEPAKVEPAKPARAAPADAKTDPTSLGKAWVKDLPSGSWILQHAAMETQEEAFSIRAKTPGLQDAHVVWTRRKSGKAYFIVVTGPYSNRQAAEAEMKKSAVMSKSWLRSARALQGQMED